MKIKIETAGIAYFLLQFIFITAKIFGGIDWSWRWVLSPTLVNLTVAAVIYLFPTLVNLTVAAVIHLAIIASNAKGKHDDSRLR